MQGGLWALVAGRHPGCDELVFTKPERCDPGLACSGRGVLVFYLLPRIEAKSFVVLKPRAGRWSASVAAGG